MGVSYWLSEPRSGVSSGGNREGRGRGGVHNRTDTRIELDRAGCND